MTAGADAILPDGDLPPDLLTFAHHVRHFAEAELRPHARRIDEQETFRREVVTALAGADLLCGPIDPAWGGGGWTAMQLAVAHEELGAVCGNTRGFLAVHGGLVAGALAAFASDEQKQRWLPQLCTGRAIGCFGLTEELAGSDVAALACRAEPAGPGRWRLSGRKIWITNGGIADLVLTFATVDPARGRDGITAFAFEAGRRGLRREPMPGRDLGHRGSDHAQLLFDGVEVGDDDVVGGVGGGFAVAMGALSEGRLSVAAGAVGIHRAALDAALRFTAERHQFGKPIASFQMVQERVADMAAELLAARGLVWRCAWRRDRGVGTPIDLAVAKLYATEAATRAADTAVMLHGGRGYSSAWPVERLLRDSVGLRIYEGTSMVQKLIIARALGGR